MCFTQISPRSSPSCFSQPHLAMLLMGTRWVCFSERSHEAPNSNSLPGETAAYQRHGSARIPAISAVHHDVRVETVSLTAAVHLCKHLCTCASVCVCVCVSVPPFACAAGTRAGNCRLETPKPTHTEPSAPSRASPNRVNDHTGDLKRCRWLLLFHPGT